VEGFLEFACGFLVILNFGLEMCWVLEFELWGM
jgi:hypothetical protein